LPSGLRQEEDCQLDKRGVFCTEQTKIIDYSS